MILIGYKYRVVARLLQINMQGTAQDGSDTDQGSKQGSDINTVESAKNKMF